MAEFDLNSYATKYTLIIDDIAFDSSKSKMEKLDPEIANHRLTQEIETLRTHTHNLKQAIEAQNPF